MIIDFVHFLFVFLSQRVKYNWSLQHKGRLCSSQLPCHIKEKENPVLPGCLLALLQTEYRNFFFQGSQPCTRDWATGEGTDIPWVLNLARLNIFVAMYHPRLIKKKKSLIYQEKLISCFTPPKFLFVLFIFFYRSVFLKTYLCTFV